MDVTVKDIDIKIALEELVVNASNMANVRASNYQVKFMGWVKRFDNLKHGYYVRIQNFDKLTEAKKSKNDRFVRFTYRCKVMKDSPSIIIEIVKWQPSMGNITNTKQIFEGELNKSLSTVLDHMASTMSEFS